MKWSSKSINFSDIPDSLFEKKIYIFSYSLNDRAEASIDFLNNRYKESSVFVKAVEFIDGIYLEGFRADVDSLLRIGFFPANESAYELNEGLVHALIGSYKSAFDHVRRALELVLVGGYFCKKEVSKAHAKEWIESHRQTPLFSHTVNEVKKDSPFLEIDADYYWAKNIKALYWEICDITHVRGEANSSRILNETSCHFGSMALPNITETGLSRFADLYIRVVQEIATMMALFNPPLLIGLPIEEKFGVNEPIGGYYNEFQSAKFKEILPEHYREFFESFVKEDSEIIGVHRYFNDLPDLSDDDINKQIQEWERLLNVSTKKVESEE